jgi:hypothetical protein
LEERGRRQSAAAATTPHDAATATVTDDAGWCPSPDDLQLSDEHNSSQSAASNGTNRVDTRNNIAANPGNRSRTAACSNHSSCCNLFSLAIKSWDAQILR